MPVWSPRRSPGRDVYPLLFTSLLLVVLLAGCNGGKSINIRETSFGNNEAETLATRSARTRTIASPPRHHLTWQPPLTREDGSSLYPGEILGYRIYFKKNHHDHFRTIPVNDPFDTRLSLDRFSPGVYQFSISTIDLNGLESRRSAVIRVDVT